MSRTAIALNEQSESNGWRFTKNVEPHLISPSFAKATAGHSRPSASLAPARRPHPPRLRYFCARDFNPAFSGKFSLLNK